MFLDFVTHLVATGGVVTSALLVALTIFVLKFVTYRQFELVDVVVALSELPAVGSATCCSLIIAAMYLPQTEPRLLAAFLSVSLLILLINLAVFRYVEGKKLALGGVWVRVTVFIAVSFLITYFAGLSAALRAFHGVAP